jgi:hypothetical protein
MTARDSLELLVSRDERGYVTEQPAITHCNCLA